MNEWKSDPFARPLLFPGGSQEMATSFLKELGCQSILTWNYKTNQSKWDIFNKKQGYIVRAETGWPHSLKVKAPTIILCDTLTQLKRSFNFLKRRCYMLASETSPNVVRRPLFVSREDEMRYNGHVDLMSDYNLIEHFPEGEYMRDYIMTHKGEWAANYISSRMGNPTKDQIRRFRGVEGFPALLASSQ